MVYFSDVVVSFCGQVVFLALQASMLTTAMDLQQNSNEKKLSSIPYLTLLVNCIVWSVYSTMRGLFALFLPNALGVFVGFYCSLVYHQFSRIPMPVPHIAVASAIVVLTFVLASAGSVGLVGLLATTLAFLVYASPLATIRTVIREKSTASLPFHTSLLIWLSAFFWTMYGGFVAKDYSVLVSSLAGLCTGSIQLFMFALYGFPPEGRFV